MVPTAVPDNEVLDFDAVAEGVAGLRTSFVNIFALADPSGWCLIDTGLSLFSGRVRAWAERRFGATRPHAIVLTHAHFDHVGGVDDLAELWNVPVYAHPDEIDYVRGAKAYPPPDSSVGGGLMARMAGLYPRRATAFAGDVRALPPDGSVPGLPSWQWLATPGHCRGHVSLFRAADRTLVAGDAFCTTQQESLLAVATQRPELHGPPAYFTTDWTAARESVHRLASLEPACIAPGHGPALSGIDTLHALRTLSDRFDELARPDHGRYVHHLPEEVSR